MGYYREKCNSLYEKLSATYINEKISRNLPKMLKYNDLPYFSCQLIGLCENLFDEIVFLKGSIEQKTHVEQTTVDQNNNNISNRPFTDEEGIKPSKRRTIINFETPQSSIINIPHPIFNSTFDYLNPRILSNLCDTWNLLMQNSINRYIKQLPTATQRKIDIQVELFGTFEWNWTHIKESERNILLKMIGNFLFKKVNRLVVRGEMYLELSKDKTENEEALIAVAKKFKNLKKLEFDTERIMDLHLLDETTHRIVNQISDSCKYLRTFIYHGHLPSMDSQVQKDWVSIIFEKCSSIDVVEMKNDVLFRSYYFTRSDVMT